MRHVVRCLQTVALITLFLSAKTGVQAQTRWATPGKASFGKTTYSAQQVIVKPRANIKTSEMTAVRRDLQAQALAKFPSIGAELWQISGETVESAIAQYRDDPRIEYIEPNYRWSMIRAGLARLPNDPRFSQMWGLHNTGQTGGTSDADIDAPEAWDIETGREVIVGVIDSGVDWTHEDLSANIWVNTGEIPGNRIDDDRNGYIDDVRGWDFVNNDNDPMDDFGHGTHVAGTIAAAGNNGLGTVGVCWKAKIMPLKFLGVNGSGTTANAILAIEYATRMRAQLTNNSWGGGSFSQALRDAIDAAGRAGQLFIAAAGNGGTDNIGDNNDLLPHYPSNYPLDNIIAVAATDHNDRLGIFSNFGLTSVDLGAPGVSILSTLPGNSYTTASGTSMATPHVSGVAALMWSRVPGLNHLKLKELLLKTVDPLAALQGKTVSGGRLNALKAVQLVEPDSLAPAAVTDLVARDPKSNFITLTWTASGDDGDSGKATAYDVRYSTAPITESNFAAATKASGAPAPKAAGMQENFTVGGLNFKTTYYFALKVLDEQGNTSALSNSPAATTLGIPMIAVTPDSLVDSLLTGAQSTQTLKINNKGEGTLDFKVRIEGASASAFSLSVKANRSNETRVIRTDLARDETAASAVVPAAKSAVEKLPFYDGFESGNFNKWVNDGGSGTKEVTSATAAVGKYSFHYQYTGSANHIHGIHQDFEKGSQPKYIGFYIRSSSVQNSDAYFVVTTNQPGITEVIWFYAKSTGFLYVNADVGGDETYPYKALQWYHIEFRDIDWAAKNFDYYVDSRLVKADIPFRNSAVVNDIDRLYLYNFHSGSEAWWDEIDVGGAGGSTGWLTARLDSGSVAAGSTLDLQLQFDATGLNGGNYRANVAIASNDTNKALVKIPARLLVIGAPDIALSDSVLNLGAIFIGDTSTAKLTVSNLGTDRLRAKLAVDNINYAIAPDTLNLEPLENQDILVRFIPKTLGESPGVLTFTTNDPDEPKISLALRGRSLPPPELAISPDSLNAALITGQTVKKVLTIANTGGSDLKFELGFENVNVPTTVSIKVRDISSPNATALSTSTALAAPGASRFIRLPLQSVRDQLLQYARQAVQGIKLQPPLSEGSQALSAADLQVYERFRSQLQPYSQFVNQVRTASALPAIGVVGFNSTTMLSYLLSRPDLVSRYTFTDLGNNFDLARIQSYAGLIVDEIDAGITLAEAQALRDFYDMGKPIILGMDDLDTVESGVQTRLFPVFGISAVFDRGFIFGALNPRNPITKGLSQLDSFNDNDNDYYTLSGADWICADPQGDYFGVSFQARSRAVLLGERLGGIWFAGVNNQLLIANGIDWMMGGQNSWVSIRPDTGTVRPNSRAEIEVTFNAAGLRDGDYTADLVVNTNDPAKKKTLVPVRLQVTGAPDIAAAQDTLDFGPVFLGAKPSLKVTVQNQGTRDLLIFSAVPDPAVYTVLPPYAGIDPGEEEVFTVRFSPQTAGNYPGTLTFTSNDEDEPKFVVTLLGQGVTPPIIAVTPPSFAFNLNAGDSARAMMNIANTGGSALNFTIRDEETLPVNFRGGQKLYWTGNDTVQSSNLDGTAIQALFTKGLTLGGIAIDDLGRRLYWTDSGDRTIRSSRLDGSDVKVLISGSVDAVGIAIDPVAGKMYWTDFNAGVIRRANLDGTGAVIVVQGIAAFAKNTPGPWDAAPAGKSLNVPADENTALLSVPWGVALDLVRGKIYWTEQNSSRIGRANLDGSGVETLISSGLNGPRGIKLDVAAGKIYFVDSFNDAIKRANLDGSQVETLLTTGAGSNPLDLTLDPQARQFYWTDNSFDQIQRANFDGRNARIIITRPAPGFEGPISIALSSGTNWLTQNPANGNIPADSTKNIDLLVNTKSLADGEYKATMIVASNDTKQPEVSVPVILRVTGVPTLAVTPDTLKFGATFINATATDTLIVSNPGTALLTVSGVVSDQAEFTVDTTRFNLNPGEKKLLSVTFKPLTVKAFSGRLTITSNDPKRPSVTVVLLGTGIVPPKIAVMPDSLRANLLTGKTAKQILKISNNGGSDLAFNIAIENPAAPALARQTSAPDAMAQPHHTPNWSEWPKHWGAVPSMRLSSAAAAKLRLVSDAIESALPVVIKDSTGDGGVVDLTLLRGASTLKELQIEMEFATTLDSLNFGGYLSLDTDQNAGTGRPPTFGKPTQNIGAEYEFLFFSAAIGQVDLYSTTGGFIASYPIQFTSNTLRFSTPLADLGNDDGNIDVTGVLGNRAGPTDWFPDIGHGTIRTGVSWLSVDPVAGKIAAGASAEINVIFDAAGLQGGDYSARIVIASNDPSSSRVTIPANLRVTGAPVIAVSDTLLNYGKLFVGVTATDTLIVSNRGTDRLTVSGFAVDNTDYRVNSTGLTLIPGESKAVPVSFTPSTTGNRDGVLTIASDDPSNRQLRVKLAGEGVAPPIISVNPAALEFMLPEGDTATAIMTIANTGGSPLNFKIRDEESPRAQAADGRKLYWTEPLAAPDTLHRSNLDGSEVERLFTNNASMRGIAADETGKRLYWADRGDGTIRSSRLDGSDIKVLFSGVDALDLAIDHAAGKIYWTNFSSGVINKANLDGTGVIIIVTSTGSFNAGRHAEPNEELAPVPSARVEASSALLSGPWGIALDLKNGKVYWTEQNGDRIGRANLDGSSVETIIATGINGPRGLKLDVAAGKIYFVDSFSRAIKRANLDGSQVETILNTGTSSNPLDLELDIDAQRFYWTDNLLNQILRANFDGSDVQVIIKPTFAQLPFGIGLFLGTGWLTETPNSGTIAAGASQDVKVKVDAKTLSRGDYTAKILVESDDPKNLVVTVPVKLQVKAGALLIAIADTLHGVPNETVDVPVYLELNHDSLAVAALGAAIRATNRILTFDGFTPGPIIQGMDLVVTAPAPDSVRLAFLATGRRNITQSGLLVTLRFKIAPNATVGQTALLNFSGLTAVDSSAKSLAFAGDNGMLKVNKALLLAGRTLYAGGSRPAANLSVKLKQNGAAVQEIKTDAAGNYSLANIIPGSNYRVEVGRPSGGVGAAITPTDALMALRAPLSGAQKLAADVDGNLAVEANDATMIFNYYLGLLAQFPVEAWRAFPANFNINATPEAWKTAPEGVDYPSLRSDRTGQDFTAVVRGDVDLDWLPVAGANPALTKSARRELADTSAAPLQIAVTNAVVAPGAKTITWQIRLDGDALQKGLYAFGAELRYNAAAFEITQMRWGKSIPSEDFQLRYLILPETPAEESAAAALTGGLRFGGFSTSGAAIWEAGILIEVDAQLRTELAAGTSLPIRLVEVSAALGATPDSDEASGLSRQHSGFANAEIAVVDGEVQVTMLPTEFALQANYPNPFWSGATSPARSGGNPATMIRYQLPEAATVKLEIFNTLGQKVRTLVNRETQPIGYYNREWNGRNDAGNLLPSGVYFYRFEAKSTSQVFAKTRKMLMVK